MMHQFNRDAERYGEESDGGINWPQTFIALTVVGVAAWGLWFFLRDKSDAKPSQLSRPALPRLPELTPPIPNFAPGPNGGLVPVPSVPAPVAPAPAQANEAPIFLVGDPLVLKQGQHYRAKLKLSGFQATFATKELVQAQFLANGFTDVIAYKALTDLPSDWPQSTVQGGGGIWWAEGNWSGASGPVKRQEQIVQVWEA